MLSLSDRTYRTAASPLLFYSLLIVIVLRSMPTKKDLRNEVGAIVHAVANRALSDHTAKNIFGNVNYAKHFLQGTVVGFFDGRAPGGKNAVWKLTVDFEMPSDGAEVELKRVDVHRQHCVLGAVPAGKNPHCSVTFTDSIGDPDHAVKGSSTYLPNAEARAATASAAAAAATDDDDNDDAVAVAVAAAPRVSLSPAPLVAAPANDDIEIVLPPPPPPPVKTKRKRKKATSCDDASTTTPLPAKKSKATTKKKKASKTVNLRENPVWVVPTDGKRHRVVAIAHETFSTLLRRASMRSLARPLFLPCRPSPSRRPSPSSPSHCRRAFHHRRRRAIHRHCRRRCHRRAAHCHRAFHCRCRRRCRVTVAPSVAVASPSRRPSSLPSRCHRAIHHHRRRAIHRLCHRTAITRLCRSRC